ncbi:MAG TPA: VirB8/TrbF family protein [Mycobacteriales bacterium]|nr:VirB8/TrbF family protein [Mycobacteriales bacterium]
MPVAVRRQENLVLRHRDNFAGKPTGPNTLTWEYQGGTVHLVMRPDDGKPAKPWRVRCKACRKQLQFKVYSVKSAERRQSRWRLIAWSLLAVSALSVAACFLVSPGAAVATFAVLAVLSAGGAFGCSQYAGDEAGISGHGAGKAYAAKHMVELVNMPDDPV